MDPGYKDYYGPLSQRTIMDHSGSLWITVHEESEFQLLSHTVYSHIIVDF